MNLIWKGVSRARSAIGRHDGYGGRDRWAGDGDPQPGESNRGDGGYDSARRSKEQCSLLSEHVQNIRNLLTQLDNQWTPDLATEGVLRSLKTALDDALLLVEACQIEKPWYKRLAPSRPRSSMPWTNGSRSSCSSSMSPTWCSSLTSTKIVSS